MIIWTFSFGVNILFPKRFCVYILRSKFVMNYQKKKNETGTYAAEISSTGFKPSLSHTENLLELLTIVDRK